MLFCLSEFICTFLFIGVVANFYLVATWKGNRWADIALCHAGFGGTGFKIVPHHTHFEHISIIVKCWVLTRFIINIVSVLYNFSWCYLPNSLRISYNPCSTMCGMYHVSYIIIYSIMLYRIPLWPPNWVLVDNVAAVADTGNKPWITRGWYVIDWKDMLLSLLCLPIFVVVS